MCLARSIMKSRTVKLYAHSVLDSIVRMVIRHFVDHQPVDVILRCISHHSIMKKLNKNKCDKCLVSFKGTSARHIYWHFRNDHMRQ